MSWWENNGERPWYKPDKWFVSPYTWSPEARKTMSGLPKKVYFRDATLREGEETAGVAFTIDDKVEIAKKLDEIGIADMDMGHMDKKHQVETLRKVKEAGVRQHLTAYLNLRRDWKNELAIALDAGADSVKITGIGVSPKWLTPHRFDPKHEAYHKGWELLIKSTKYVKKNYPDVPITVGPTNFTRGPENFELAKENYKKCIEAGAERIQINDSMGAASPGAIRFIVSELKKVLPDTPILLHMHNDFGLSLANCIAGAEVGAEWFDTTILGLGDRAGNIPFEPLVCALEMLYGVETGIKLEKLYNLARFVEEIGGLKAYPMAPIIGEKVWFEESHTGGILQSRKTGTWLRSEAYRPHIVGNSHTPVFGMTAVNENCIKFKLEELDLKYTEDDIERVYDETIKEIEKRMAQGKVRYLYEEEFNELCRRVVKQ